MPRGFAPSRIDGNQKEIIAKLREVPGISVFSTAMVGKGFFDIVVGFRGVNWLIEVKDPAQPPSKRRLTDDESAFHAAWNGQKAVALTVEDIFKLIGLGESC